MDLRSLLSAYLVFFGLLGTVYFSQGKVLKVNLITMCKPPIEFISDDSNQQETNENK